MVSDEEWDEFARKAAEDRQGAPKEPSARARMVTERLRQEEEERAKAGRKRFGRRAEPVRNEPPGWRTGPAWQEMQGRRSGSRVKAGLAIVLIAGLALVVLRPELLIDRISGKAEQDEKSRQPLAAESVRPTAAPEQVYPDQPTLKEPFRGSPAAQWADGAAGIELPEAKAVGGLTKEQVADAVSRTKALLVAANLDPRTLRGERPEAALKLLEPRQPTVHGWLVKGLAAPGKEQDPVMMFTRFDPAEVRLVGDVVKTRGRMWFEAGERPGEVLVKADYSFVYPLVRVKKGSEEVARTVVRRQLTVAVNDPARYTVTQGTLAVLEYPNEIANSACGIYDGFLHPTFPSDGRVAGTEPSGPAEDPYDRSTELSVHEEEGCGQVSRT
ncbi:hypothetical protein [Streptomyces venezuelae]|uniref:hypothetical protein n=1 Tax=Streptomyces venezuelae TaxID=54571 RepID=UPI001CC2283D|nr:hypothetical protein [Streptomyces venezuelae]